MASVLLGCTVLFAACTPAANPDLAARPITSLSAIQTPQPESRATATAKLAPSAESQDQVGSDALVEHIAPMPTPLIREITVASADPASARVRVVPVTELAMPTIQVASPLDVDTTLLIAETISPTVTSDAEPLIFTSFVLDQKCGHGDVAAVDGHTLYATPRLVVDGGNFLQRLPTGSRLDLIDCRLWTDENEVGWLAVRTADKKLGWMIVQPDSFYITLYPIHLAIPKAVTGIPAGSMVAYMPPSECVEGPVTTKATVTSIGIDFIPVVGDLKGLNEAATGCDMVTGESLGDWRWLGLFGIIGFSEVALLRHGGKAADAARAAGNLGGVRFGDEVADVTRNSDELAGVVGKNIDTVADVARAAGKADAIADVAADAARAVDKSTGLSNEMVAALAKMEQPCSFSADTPVATDLGPVPIGEIKPGALVLAYNENTRTTGYYTVTASFSHIDPVIVSLHIGEDVVHTTPEHPFYYGGEWFAAGLLKPGDKIVSASGHSDGVKQVFFIRFPQRMVNLTVAVAHTYFVGDGQWLVHNACSRVLRQSLSNDKGVKALDNLGYQWQAHHIIPQAYESHNVVEQANLGGKWFDGADNGIALPYDPAQAAKICEVESVCLPIHRGYHSAYSDRVGRELDQIQRRADQSPTLWTEQQYRAELTSLVNRLRRDINGQHVGNPLH
jgi:hypothetical protein